MKKEVLDKVELIKSSNNMPLEDYCKAVYQYLPHKHDINPMNMHNDNAARLAGLLLPLASKGILPELKGFIGTNSIREAGCFSHKNYIETKEDEDGILSMYVSLDGKDEGDDKCVATKSVNVISAFQESEVLATSTELEGHYYIVYHDDGFTPIAINDDNFIKALCSLSLMTDVDVYFGMLEHLPNSRNSDLSDALETLARIVFGGDDSMCNLDNFRSRKDYAELHDKYWDFRENVSD